ncbi:MAG TPA: NAD(P)-dependent oxidoreductase, partial [Ilumatobacteraceae bacterium]|nr:NAD(P)-dependent oxidoreductase [Ilumatobacteraceae bacterium]
AELAVRQAAGDGLDAVIVRPPWFYGPLQPPRQTTFFRMVRTGRFPIFGRGDQRRSMVYLDNLVQGVVRAELTDAARGNGYWIADARPYTVTEIVATVGRALRDEGYEVKGGGMKMPVLVGRIAERADRILQGAGRYQQQLHVLGEMAHSIACDISAAQAELGYDPQVELYEGMRRSIQWCRAEGLDL